MIDKISIPNGAKYFSSGIFQNYLVFIINTLNVFMPINEFIFGNLMECQKKVLKI